MTQQFYSLVKKRIKARQELLDNTLKSGAIASMEEYKSITGKRRGLEEGLDVLKQAFQDFFNDGDSYDEIE